MYVNTTQGELNLLGGHLVLSRIVLGDIVRSFDKEIQRALEEVFRKAKNFDELRRMLKSDV